MQAPVIDGKALRKFLFARKTFDGRGNAVFVGVEAFDKDHAVKRLQERYPTVPRLAWDFLDEIEFHHVLGGLGEDLPLPFIVAASRMTQ